MRQARHHRAADYLPGDIGTWRLPSGVPHIGIVGRAAGKHAPMAIHTIGAGTREEDLLFACTITGHYGYLVVDAAPGEDSSDRRQ